MADELDQALVEVEEQPAEPEIEIIDDTPEKDKGRPTVEQTDWVKTEETKKRVQALDPEARIVVNGFYASAKAHERKAQRLAQEQASAAEMIRNLIAERDGYQSALADRERSLLEATSLAMRSEKTVAEKELSAAHSSGDPDLIAAAQMRAATAAARAENVGQYEVAANADRDRRPQQQQQSPQQQYIQPQQQQPQGNIYEFQQRELTARNKFLAEHPVLTDNPELTNMLVGVMEEQGFDSNRATFYTDQYYNHARELMKQLAGDTQKPQNTAPNRGSASVVTPMPSSPGARTNGGGESNTKIKVPGHIIDYAKRNGIDPTKMAIEWNRLEKEKGK